MILLIIIFNNILLNLVIKFIYYFIFNNLFFDILNSIYLLLKIGLFI